MQRVWKRSIHVPPVRGTRTIFPSDSASRELVLEKLTLAAQQHSFQQIITPVLEHTELFSRSLGTASDIVMKEMYTFQDKSGNSLTLRPEGTAGVLRALLTSGTGHRVLPQKVFYHGSMFRYERPQRGRFREFQQFGIEYIGEDDPLVDAETISVAHYALSLLGLSSKADLHINTLGDAESREKYTAVLTEYFESRRSELSPESQMRLERGSPLRILDSKSPVDQQFFHECPIYTDHLTVEAQKRYHQVLQGLEDMGISYIQNPRLVRGLDYYCHTAFEFIEKSEDENSTPIALIAGGRYDNLSQQLGGRLIPCIGWAAGVDRLCLDFESTRRLNRLAIVPVIDQQNDTVSKFATSLLKTLRAMGWSVQYCHGSDKLKKKMKLADRLNCMGAIIIGEEEVSSQSFTLKDFTTRTQETLPLSDLEISLKLRFKKE